jgi:hypothetical protein
MNIRTTLAITVVAALTTFAPPTQAKTTKSGYLASPSLELLEKAISYAVQKDEAAFEKIMATGMVISLKAGLQVEIVDTKFFKGLVKIRPRGETLELWTNIEAVGD